MRTPVALLIFRRPDLTERVFKAVAAAKPRRLLIVADGPRAGRPDDVEACAATRAVVERVDWNCEVTRNYSEVNLGCGRRPASGISWVFEQVEEAIILEDDCIPDETFYPFCDEMLERYRDDERVMHVAGSTFQRKPMETPYSYCFSRFNCSWGWATWRRAWKHFDFSVLLWPRLKATSFLADCVEDERAIAYWSEWFDKAAGNDPSISFWDYQWTFACWANSGLSILPRTNLVSNIGCGPNATHTFDPADPVGNIPATRMSFPLVHPPSVLVDRANDRAFLRNTVLARQAGPRTRRIQGLRQLAYAITPNFVRDWYEVLTASGRQ